MKKIIIISIAMIVIVISNCAHAQNTFPATGSAGIGTTMPAASSLLDMESTSKGFLAPRMMKTQRDAIVSPAKALLIYQTDNIPGFYYYNGTAWTAVSQGTGSQWVTNGSNIYYNAGNVGIGTTIPTAKLQVAGDVLINGLTVGLGGAGSLGTVAVGYNALHSNTGNGIANTALGNNTLSANTTGVSNTASGSNALSSNKTGSNNTAYGAAALASNTTGYSNTASGVDALYSNTTGYYNIATGDSALFLNTTGSFNTASGFQTLYHNNDGWYNTALGRQALYSNTGEDNTASGSQALYSNSSGSENTASGGGALYHNNDGWWNTASGSSALLNNISGSGNTALGAGADVNSSGYISNSSTIGWNSLITASNQVMLGNTSVAWVEAAGGYYLYSDGRFKKNIKEDIHGLDFINQLKPITYNYDIHKLNAYIAPEKTKKDALNAKEKSNIEAGIKNKENILYSGFIAQDVEAAAKKIDYDFSGIHKPQNDKDPYGLSYADFVVPLVKAVQELSKMNDAKDATIDTLQQQNADLQKQFNDLKTLVLSIQQTQQSCSACSAIANQTIAQSSVVLIDASSLQQNVPNPFTNTTSIGYTLPQKFTSAQILITDKNGVSIKAVKISGSGKGNVSVNASTLSSGTYQYSLIVDGRLIDTKQMVFTK